MRSFAALFLPVLAAANPIGIVTGGDGPSPDQIQIVSVSASGNGCPQGTVTTDMSDDRTIVTFGFDAFQTYIGPGTTVADKSKNCQLHLSLSYPGGFQYSVVESTYHGYAQLETGVTGTFYSTYYFSQDAAATTTTETSIEGGSEWEGGDVYTKQDQVPTASVIWSPCGASGILNVNNRIALTSNDTTASGQISDDDATVAFTQQTHLSWQACQPITTVAFQGPLRMMGSILRIIIDTPDPFTLKEGSSVQPQAADQHEINEQAESAEQPKLSGMMMMGRDTYLSGLVLCKPLMPLSYFIQQIKLHDSPATSRNIYINVGYRQPNHTRKLKFTVVVYLEIREQLVKYGGPECEGSYTCHWGICMGFFHINLESSAGNQHRKSCAKEASKGYRKGRKIEEFCSQDTHRPRYRLQMTVDDSLSRVVREFSLLNRAVIGNDTLARTYWYNSEAGDPVWSAASAEHLGKWFPDGTKKIADVSYAERSGELPTMKWVDGAHVYNG
ncbi:Uu.00g119610.m01.CDS01 [Anthostomella pinea]|uniref:Uu.00g119610.m01.CDS01 n=1 Tax=Anthostomella pinea TaxID=933095 RepID=A0AAI8VBE4_9PEZI|nr:Uu.00g119610.m01.CDS01 [Anthostomella pinea]